MTTYTIIRHPSGNGWTFDTGQHRAPSHYRRLKPWPSFVAVALYLQMHRGAHWWQIVIPAKQPSTRNQQRHERQETNE